MQWCGNEFKSPVGRLNAFLRLFFWWPCERGAAGPRHGAWCRKVKYPKVRCCGARWRAPCEARARVAACRRDTGGHERRRYVEWAALLPWRYTENDGFWVVAIY
jgi:hypothetical protein